MFSAKEILDLLVHGQLKVQIQVGGAEIYKYFEVSVAEAGLIVGGILGLALVFSILRSRKF